MLHYVTICHVHHGHMPYGSHPLAKTWDLLMIHGSFGVRPLLWGWRLWRSSSMEDSGARLCPPRLGLSVLHPTTLLETTEMCSFVTITCITTALGNTHTAIYIICFIYVPPLLKFVFSLSEQEKLCKDGRTWVTLRSNTKPIGPIPYNSLSTAGTMIPPGIERQNARAAQRQVSFAVTQGRDEAKMGPYEISPVRIKHYCSIRREWDVHSSQPQFVSCCS